MSVRIRSIKPEWLEDEKLGAASDEARLLSVALILMADDYGNGRASPATIAAEVWRYELAADDGVNAPGVIARARGAMAELERVDFVRLYEVAGQRYYAIRNWSKHQRVDKPGKPRVPGPGGEPLPERTADRPRVAYFIRGAMTGLVKIGESADPVGRLVELAKAGSERLELLAVGGDEKALHRALVGDRVHGEWFRPTPAVMAAVAAAGGNPDAPIAVAGYDGARKILENPTPESFATDSRPIREEVANGSGTSRAVLAPDLDQDQDQDLDQEGSGISRAHAREDHHPTPPREGPTPAGIVEAEYRTALGKVGKAHSPRSGDARHFRDAADAMRATVTDRPLRDVAREWCALYVAEKRSRSPEWLAEWCQRRASSGGPATPPKGYAEPLPASAYRGSTADEIEAAFGPVSDEDLARVDRGVRHG